MMLRNNYKCFLTFKKKLLRKENTQTPCHFHIVTGLIIISLIVSVSTWPPAKLIFTFIIPTHPKYTQTDEDG